MIRFENITKIFDRTVLLDKLSFQVAKGERLSLIGPGGCGKTTILKILLGLIQPEEGKAYLFDNEMTQAPEPEKEVVLRKVGMAFQQGGLFDFMTVKENLLFAMENMTEKNPAEMDADMKKLLAGVKLPWIEDMFPHELSGGMKRRVGVARALCTAPEVAIFDEPTAGLDPVTSTIILNMIGDLSAHRETSLLVATSNVEIAIRFANRIVVIHEGKIVADGQWRDLLIDGPEWVQDFLSVRLIGLDIEYAMGLDLPKAFIEKHWHNA